MRLILTAVAAALLVPSLAFAQPKGEPGQTVQATTQSVSQSTLLPGRLDIPVVEGSNVPDDCHFPASLSSPGHYDLACVVMPRTEESDSIGATYFGLLGQRGWHADQMVPGGFTATRAEGNCEQVLGIYPSVYPPGADEDSAQDSVIWFALDRNQRCGAQRSSQ